MCEMFTYLVNLKKTATDLMITCWNLLHASMITTVHTWL